MKERFYFSVIKVVPDPIKYEPINVGVVVLEQHGRTGDLAYNRHIKTRIRAVKSAFPIDSLFAAIEDLRYHLHLDPQRRLAEIPSDKPTLGRERL